jgi:hypothetical protein
MFQVTNIVLKIELIMVPCEFRPNQMFDETKHIVDEVAKEYLAKASSDVHHLVPVAVAGDGNCLYGSILVLMNNPEITARELRGILICISIASNILVSLQFFF